MKKKKVVSRFAKICRQLRQQNPQALTADGFDGALIGIGKRGAKAVAKYSTAKCIAILMKQGLSRADAQEYFDFNTAGAYVGPSTPIFV